MPCSMMPVLARRRHRLSLPRLVLIMGGVLLLCVSPCAPQASGALSGRASSSVAVPGQWVVPQHLALSSASDGRSSPCGDGRSTGPAGAVFVPSASAVFVADSYTNAVAVIDVTTNQVLTSISLGQNCTGPWGMAYDSGSNELFVAESQAKAIAEI